MLGNSSKLKLATCQPELRRLVEAINEGIDRGDLADDDVRDLTVTCGYRGEKEQSEAFATGTSKLQWPNSKHNHLPSLAVDIAPYPLDYSQAGIPRFRALRRYALGVAQGLGIRIRIISWDWPHYELLT